MAAIAAALALWSPAGARAGAPRAGVECALVEDGALEADGLLDDWAGIAARGDGVRVRCAHSERTLYLAVEVADPDLVRTSPNPARANQDRLDVRIGADRWWTAISVLPGTRGFPPVYRWNGKRAPAAVRIADAAQRRGWAVEIAAPLALVRAWGPDTPKLAFSAAYRDRGDRPVAGAPALAGTLRFAGATDAYVALLRAAGLRRRDVRVDRLVDLDGERGVERVVIGGRVIGVVTRGYRYVALPVRSPEDVLHAQVVDLDGTGRHAIVTVHREYGNGGSRDVLAVWYLQPTGDLVRALAAEVRKQLGDRVLTNRWRLVPRGARRGRRARGFELHIEAGDAVGWDATTFDDVPPEDMRPILTPWGEQTSAVFTFAGGQALGG
ncbi:MAG: hypothetical protein D6689_18025 [Deltaproteobacteria bacterium]|nr:MAG: hypothetical protein D6689_18025 [Deltaproteobacteria bacterium]